MTSQGEPSASLAEARVVHLDVEGGCWALELPGRRVQPLNLPPEFAVDGQTVLVAFELAEGMVTTCQVGDVVRIVSIRRP